MLGIGLIVKASQLGIGNRNSLLGKAGIRTSIPRLITKNKAK